MQNIMTLEFPLKRDMMTTIRLVTGGICSLAGLSLDESEDCKLVVTEGLLLLLRRGYTKACLSFSGEGKLCILARGSDYEAAAEDRAEEEISIALLNALVKNFTMKREGDGDSISFSFGG